ncbi:MAG: hydrogenase maturation nickel metallochaperone HypA [Desulfatitalea sp.]|nr:hydrogenase maturation nickel metallochaperone HypA [Desulfatitalea sp.]
MAITQSLVDIIAEEMRAHRAGKLLNVRVQIGQMTAVVPDALRFCFDILTQHTPMAGAELIVEWVPVQARCESCERTFEVKDHAFVCPVCGRSAAATSAGRELSIVEIEVE